MANLNNTGSRGDLKSLGFKLLDIDLCWFFKAKHAATLMSIYELVPGGPGGPCCPGYPNPWLPFAPILPGRPAVSKMRVS